MVKQGTRWRCNKFDHAAYFGNSPMAKTLSRLVLPHAPSPTMTSFRLSWIGSTEGCEPRNPGPWGRKRLKGKGSAHGWGRHSNLLICTFSTVQLVSLSVLKLVVSRTF
jgi:hypothetical protein